MGHIRAKIRRKRTKRRARRTAERIKRLKNKKREAWSRRARENMMLPHAKYSAQSQFYGLCSVMDDAAFRSSKTTLFIQSRKQGENVSVLTQRDIATNNLISAAAPHKRRIDEQARGCRDGMGGGEGRGYEADSHLLRENLSTYCSNKVTTAPFNGHVTLKESEAARSTSRKMCVLSSLLRTFVPSERSDEIRAAAHWGDLIHLLVKCCMDFFRERVPDRQGTFDFI